jgi:hypothetical protein
MTDQAADHSLTYITQLGTEYYLSELREKLEHEHMNEYVVIEPLSKRYYVDEDLLLAIQEAEQEFPDSFFTIIKIGSLKQPTAAYQHANAETDFFSNAVSHR